MLSTTAGPELIRTATYFIPPHGFDRDLIPLLLQELFGHRDEIRRLIQR